MSTGKPPLKPSQQRLLELLSEFFKRERSGLAEVFSLVRQFTLLLQEAKGTIQDENEAELKKEKAQYAQTTDGAKWLEGREEYYKALGEARYVSERFELADTLLEWWADVARQQNQGEYLDFPEWAETTGKVALRFSTNDVLQRISALEELRENLNRTVNEQLALEVAFLQAFIFTPQKAG